jgi:broad specificity phosphatase PhoE
MLELYLARHGQSFGNLDFALGPDTELTDLGREQAAKLGRWLVDQGYDFSALYCSTLRRARQTAEIINVHFGLAITFDPDLREAEVWLPGELPRRDAPLSAQPAAPFRPAYEAMRARVKRTTARILEENARGRVLVVAHGGTLGTMVRGILGSHALLLHTDLTAVHSLSWDEGLWNLRYVNRQEHLTISVSDTPAAPPTL